VRGNRLRVLKGLGTDRRRALIAAALILVLASFLRLYHIGWSFSSNGVDEGIMLERSLMVSHGYQLYSGMPSDQAPLAFYVGALLDGNVMALRSFVAVLSIVAIAVSMIAAKRLTGNNGMLITGLLLAVDFALLRESRLFSLDAISSSFLALSLLPFLMYIKSGSRAMLITSGLMIGLSSASKLLGVLGLIGMLLFMILELRPKSEQRPRRILDIIILVAVSAIPVGMFMVALGPGDMIHGMVFDQGHRSYEFGLKLSVLGFFAVNIAYLLPLVNARIMWRERSEFRFLLALSFVLLAFMVFQPLTFLHHMVMLSPPLAILAGSFIASAIEHKKRESSALGKRIVTKKNILSANQIIALAVVGILVSTGLGAYGLATQGRPIQEGYAKLIQMYSRPNQWVVSGDPLMVSLADRLTPPSLVNMAYRQYPDITEQALESEIIHFNVTVVVVCYRLNDMPSLPLFLTANGYRSLGGLWMGGSEPVLNLFESGIGPVTFFYKS
jgi:4-amino-4-deoxy-L-arabinose transferase-like glycosyltransferase